MSVIMKISMRNLIRQRTRNTFLGVSLALSICILILAGAFINGLNDIMFNKVIIHYTGHIRIVMQESTVRKTNIIRDNQKFIDKAKEVIPDLNNIDEDISVSCRALGNKKAANIYLVGVKRDAGLLKDMEVKKGDVRNMYEESRIKPVIIYEGQAEELNVDVGDTIRTRLTDINGQVQAAQFKIAAIAVSKNLLIDTMGFVFQEDLRPLLGLKQNESMGLDLFYKTVNDKKKVIEEANKLHSLLTPDAAGITASITGGIQSQPVPIDLFAYNIYADKDLVSFINGDFSGFSKDDRSGLLNAETANSLRLAVGDKITLEYPVLNTDKIITDIITIRGIIDNPDLKSTLIVNQEFFYDHYFTNLPENVPDTKKVEPLRDALIKEWRLLARSTTSGSVSAKYQRLRKTKWRGRILDIQTMYESQSEAVQIQSVLQLISFGFVAILFIVILIGVINTLRMSIKERTREIGTNRAIGMQVGDVRALFVIEVFFLAIISCIAGTLVSFILMKIISSTTFNLGENSLSLFLVNKHIYFLPSAEIIFSNFLIIVIISIITAYFPANKAAKMSITNALGHYE